jgi:FkbM family methyltransferase
MSDHPWAPPREVLTPEWLDGDLRVGHAATVSLEEQTIFDTLTDGFERNLVLYGAGNLGRRTLAGLRRAGMEPLAFADRAPGFQGASVDGLRVLSPEAAALEFGAGAVFVVTVWSPSREHVIAGIADSLRASGAHCVVSFVPLFWKYAAEFLPYLCLDLPHRLYEDGEAVREAYVTFQDLHSRQQFLLQLSYLLSTMDTFDLPRGGMGASYFPDDLVQLSEDEVFIDCGAYDGDTLAPFLEASRGSFNAVVAFEPDPNAFAGLRTFIQAQPPDVRDRIRLEQKAVGNAAGLLRFDGDGTPGSRVSSTGTITVESVKLDDALSGIAPTFIKMDIEGAEESALLGAAETIRTCRPILAICVYHLQADLHRLPALIARLAPEYRLFLRRQGSDGDLVCFGIPNERLPQSLAGI